MLSARYARGLASLLVILTACQAEPEALPSNATMQQFANDLDEAEEKRHNSEVSKAQDKEEERRQVAQDRLANVQ